MGVRSPEGWMLKAASAPEVLLVGPPAKRKRVAPWVAQGEEVGSDHWSGYAEIGEGSGSVPAGYVDAVAGFCGGRADVDEG